MQNGKSRNVKDWPKSESQHDLHAKLDCIILHGSTTVHTSGLANVRVPKDFVEAGTTEQQIYYEHEDSVEQDPAQAGQKQIT